MFGGEIKNKNKNCYSNFYACTEAKIAFIPAEELKDSKMNKISETKNPKDNSYGADRAVNNKSKESKKNKKDQHSNDNYGGNKN